MSSNVIQTRIKSHYEGRSQTSLLRRCPVILRCDGKNFKNYSKNLTKPFDEGLISDMQQTAIYLCENIQGAKCAYTQSDEISILITDYDTLNTDAWFDYNVQKMVSISASIATAKFNELRFIRQYLIKSKNTKWDKVTDETMFMNLQLCLSYANFDSRVFNIPKEEVANYFLARQKDAVKNSISMLAQSLYSPSELHKKNQSDMQELSFQKGHNWNDLHWSKKRGSFIVKQIFVNGELAPIDKVSDYGNPQSTDVIRTKWNVIETPITFDESIFNKYL